MKVASWGRHLAGFLSKPRAVTLQDDIGGIAPELNRRDIHMTMDKPLVSDRFPRSSKYHPEWVVAGASGGAQLAVDDRVARRGARLAARHAGAGPRLRTGVVVDRPWQFQIF